MDPMSNLSIIRLYENIVSSGDTRTDTKRSSDVSADSSNNGFMTPSSLTVDLVHYKELFSKLRFSYLEQVTKEKFLRAITSDIPLFVEPQENSRLEQQLAEEKIALKKQKEEVERLVTELETQGKELARRYEAVQLQKTRLSELPTKISELESQISALQSSHPSPVKNSNPELNLSLPQTLSLLSDRKSEASDLEAQIKALQAQIPQKRRELENAEDELHPLMGQKKTVVGLAKQVRQRREEGGIDETEEQGRWYRASEAVLVEMLGVSS
ncbi:uncharacterized protein PV09_07502 [Verruconis gallopava]|uniref:Kinetochore protein Sos7 coiled-coil domain-containing protein n=1 Tax=Verruconis gallopava TaxID=253628 RepID=A0A0D2A3J7_9PEZI|nr:uncharacterized protein PV09_07502 [Verruconis gallopava]KIW00980.1 hypothetical protein PV09_07502 [Verruconis gallopava]